MTPRPEGLLLVDKPTGPTSHDVVDAVRRIAGARKVGHAGTLDPPASGLLPLALGGATRLLRFLPHSPKVYEGTIELGVTTATDDLSGDVIGRHGGPLPGPAAVAAAASTFRGAMSQKPPAYSARKVGGERMYRLARRGERVEAPPSEITVHRFELAPGGGPASWRFVTEVSGGTYVRALARDLGALLGCGAALASLRRISIGPLGLDQAVPLGRLEEGGVTVLQAAVWPLEAIPLSIPDAVLPDDDSCSRFAAGRSIPTPGGLGATGPARVLSSRSSLLGVGEICGEVLQPRVVLRREPAS